MATTFTCPCNSNKVDDAYTQKLIEKLNEPDDSAICNIGLMGSFFMCVSLYDSNPLTNQKNNYQRKLYLRVLDSDEDTTTTNRLAALQVIKSFLEETANNKYGTKVHIQVPGWDLTPPSPQALPKLDHYLQYGEIVKVASRLC